MKIATQNQLIRHIQYWSRVPEKLASDKPWNQTSRGAWVNFFDRIDSYAKAVKLHESRLLNALGVTNTESRKKFQEQRDGEYRLFLGEDFPPWLNDPKMSKLFVGDRVLDDVLNLRERIGQLERANRSLQSKIPDLATRDIVDAYQGVIAKAQDLRDFISIRRSIALEVIPFLENERRALGVMFFYAPIIRGDRELELRSPELALFACERISDKMMARLEISETSS